MVRRRVPLLRPLMQRGVPALLGIGLLLCLWQVAALNSKGFPPVADWQAALTLFADPFYIAGPNDQGIGWNVLASLQRVATGFGLAALVGIPAGFLIGRFRFVANMLNPLISLLRPVSPLAPVADWPAAVSARRTGVQLDDFHLLHLADDPQHRRRRAADPQDYLNVARVLRLSEFAIMRKILLPAALPGILTGMRLSIGIALAGDCRR